MVRATIIASALRTFGMFAALCSMPIAQGAQTPAAAKYPNGCYFFGPVAYDDFAKEKYVEERAYAESVRRVYRMWCRPGESSREERAKSSDEMVVAWKKLWDRDDPYNASFHESGSFDLLALMGITHAVPTLMLKDPEFTKSWVADCNATCFEIFANPDQLTGARYIVRLMRLHNDVLHHLRDKPGADSIVDMLENAEFRLVD